MMKGMLKLWPCGQQAQLVAPLVAPLLVRYSEGKELPLDVQNLVLAIANARMQYAVPERNVPRHA